MNSLLVSGAVQAVIRRLVVIGSIVFLCLPRVVGAQSPDVSFANGLLTVRASQAPLRDIIERLAKLGAFDVVDAERITGTVTADIVAAPMARALQVLLVNHNFVVTQLPADASRSVHYLLHVHSPQAGSSPETTGPIRITGLEAVRAAEQGAADDVEDAAGDPTEEAQDAQEAAEEKAERERDLYERDAAGEFAASVSIADLAANLEDDNPLVRVRVVTELSSRTSRAALPYLISALGDDDARVYDQAIEILGRRTDAESLQRLGETLTKATDTALRIRTFMVLAVRANEASAKYVEAVRHDPNTIIREAAEELISELERRRASRRQ